MRSGQVRLALTVALLAMAATADAQTVGTTSFGKFVVEGVFEWDPKGGLLEWSKGAIVTADGMTMTCDHLRAWLARSGPDFERIEAEGNVRMSGTYTAADKTKWEVKGSARSATFDSKAGSAVLRGDVDFRAVNATGGKVGVQADKLIYDQKTQKFRFERSSETRPRVEFEEPKQGSAVPGSAEGKG